MVAPAHAALDAGLRGVRAARVAVAVHGPECRRVSPADGAGGGDGGAGGDRAAAGRRALLAALHLRGPPRLGSHDRWIARRRGSRDGSRGVLALLREDNSDTLDGQKPARRPPAAAWY